MAIEPSPSRRRPVVLVATPDADLAKQLVAEMRSSGRVACVARTAAGCLRVATAIGPDIVLLDARLPRKLEGMLRSHPATAASEILRVGSKQAAGTARTRAAAAQAMQVA